MARVKDELLRLEEQEQELWASYLEWVADNEDVWQLLPTPEEVIGYDN